MTGTLQLPAGTTASPSLTFTGRQLQAFLQIVTIYHSVPMVQND